MFDSGRFFSGSKQNCLSSFLVSVFSVVSCLLLVFVLKVVAFKVFVFSVLEVVVVEVVIVVVSYS